MKSTCRRGEKFYWMGKPWACLDVQEKQLLALQLHTGDVRVFPLRSPRAKTGKQYINLIKAIDELHSRIVPGSIVDTDDGMVKITKVFRSGSAEGVNEKGDRCPIDRWILMGKIAKALVAKRQSLPVSTSTKLKTFDDVTPSPINEKESVPVSSNQSGIVGRIWKRFVEVLCKGIPSQYSKWFGRSNHEVNPDEGNAHG